MINLFSLIQDYIVDKEDGIRQLITWFLNVVMEEEALIQAGAQRYERTDSVMYRRFCKIGNFRQSSN
jgi:putative transposase